MSLSLGGLASGMDTEGVIQKLMQIERMRVQVVEAKKNALNTKQTAWRDVDSILNKVKSKLDAIRFPSIYQARTATLTNDAVASVSAGANATLVAHTLSVTQLAQTHSVGSGTQSSANTALGLTGELEINGQRIAVSSQDTLSSLRDSINNTADVGVTASVVKVMQGTTESYRLVLTSKTGGAAGAIQMADLTGGTLPEQLGFKTAGGAGWATELSKAQEALFKLNGADYQTSSNTVSDALPGLSFTLKAAGETSITVGQDTEKLATAVEEWVKSYNEALTKLADLTKYNAEQRSSGTLAGDSLARSLQGSLRSMLSTVNAQLPNGWNKLSDVGVSSGAWGTSDYGKVVLDKEKLKAKLLEDADGVARVFGAMRQNAALTSTITTSSTDGSDPTRVYSAADLLNGDTDAARFGSLGGGWQSQNPPAAAETVKLSWATTQQIDQFELFSPDADATAGIKAYDLHYRDANGTLHLLASVTDHRGSYKLLEFAPVMTNELILTITQTHDGNAARLTEVRANSISNGPAASMYSYVRQTLDTINGPIATRNQSLDRQIKQMTDQIGKMNDRLVEQEQRLRQQFTRMESALAKMRSQGDAFMSQMMGLTAQSR